MQRSTRVSLVGLLRLLFVAPLIYRRYSRSRCAALATPSSPPSLGGLVRRPNPNCLLPPAHGHPHHQPPCNRPPAAAAAEFSYPSPSLGLEQTTPSQTPPPPPPPTHTARLTL